MKIHCSDALAQKRKQFITYKSYMTYKKNKQEAWAKELSTKLIRACKEDGAANKFILEHLARDTLFDHYHVQLNRFWVIWLHLPVNQQIFV